MRNWCIHIYIYIYIYIDSANAARCILYLKLLFRTNTHRSSVLKWYIRATCVTPLNLDVNNFCICKLEIVNISYTPKCSAWHSWYIISRVHSHHKEPVMQKALSCREITIRFWNISAYTITPFITSGHHTTISIKRLTPHLQHYCPLYPH